MKKCPKCGNQAEAHHNFCFECGTKLPAVKEHEEQQDDASNQQETVALYKPCDKAELKALILDEKICLGDIDVSNITDLSGLFVETNDKDEITWTRTNFAGIDKWDVSNVTDMNSLFLGIRYFNEPIGCWNTSNVTNMSCMFAAAEFFNQPIGDWNMSKVTDASSMFLCAKRFNQDISKWNMSSLVDASAMFDGAEAFDQPIGDWDMSNVKNTSNMFHNAKAFNQPGIASWDLSSNENDVRMYRGISEDFFAALSQAKYNIKAKAFKGEGDLPYLLTPGVIYVIDHESRHFLKKYAERGYVLNAKMKREFSIGDERVFLSRHDSDEENGGFTGFAVTETGIYCKRSGKADTTFVLMEQIVNASDLYEENGTIFLKTESGHVFELCHLDKSKALDGEIDDLIRTFGMISLTIALYG